MGNDSTEEDSGNGRIEMTSSANEGFHQVHRIRASSESCSNCSPFGEPATTNTEARTEVEAKWDAKRKRDAEAAVEATLKHE